ncbi:MAG: hypothetical protein IKE22_00780 [Atopobiaceae bacterium]|nr:hypothetical protein [Atopobiaceae bacterium]
MTYQEHQRWPKHEEFIDILNDLKFGTPYLFEIAQLMFEDTVDPDAYHKESANPDEIAQCNMAFSEWTVFDFNLGNGMTPLKRIVLRDPSLKEFSETQFYSTFWVISQNPETRTSVLRDTRTHEDFVVHDEHLAKNTRWAVGRLGTRIARVDGEWRFAGQVHLHDNAPSEPLPHDGYMAGSGIQDPLAFITHLEKVIGHEGVYHQTVERFIYEDSESF